MTQEPFFKRISRQDFRVFWKEKFPASTESGVDALFDKVKECGFILIQEEQNKQ